MLSMIQKLIMLDIIKKELEIDETLKVRIGLICKLTHIKPVFHNGSLRKINYFNLIYVEQHRIEAKNVMILAFNYSNEV